MEKLARNEALLKDVASRLRRLREAKGLTQEAVYHDTGVHVGRIETGRLNVTVGTLEALCRYFGVTLADFFQEKAPADTQKLA